MRPVGAGPCLSRMLKRKLLLGAEQWMAANADLVLTMDRWDYETAKKYQLGHKVSIYLAWGWISFGLTGCYRTAGKNCAKNGASRRTPLF